METEVQLVRFLLNLAPVLCTVGGIAFSWFGLRFLNRDKSGGIKSGYTTKTKHNRRSGY